MDVEKVNWWVVIGGIFLAVITGMFVAVFATAISANLLDESVAAVAVAVVAVGLFYFGLFVLARKRMRDLATGLLIGGCIMALVTGACGYLLLNLGAL